jgi:hypothetical protein
MAYALIAALVLGAASALGDMLWAGLSLRQRVVSGLMHGALVCLLIGAFVGWRARRPASGIAAGPVIGFLAAGVFYLLAPWLRYYAMFPAWMFFWICFALLQKRLQGEGSWAQAAVRGVIAAVVAGAAFYVVSGVWTSPSREGPRYLYHFVAWSFAFLPGFAALFVRPPADGRAGRTR